MAQPSSSDLLLAGLLSKILVLTDDLEKFIRNGQIPPEAMLEQVAAIKYAMSSALLSAYMAGQAEILEENVLGYAVDLAVLGAHED